MLQAARLTTELRFSIEELPVAGLLIDEGVRIVCANAAARRLLSGDAANLTGTDLRQHVERRSRATLSGVPALLRGSPVGAIVIDVDVPKTATSAAVTIRFSASRPPTAEARDLILMLGVNVTARPTATAAAVNDSRARVVAVGRFASGLAHDLNNALQVILGRARMLRDSAVGDESTDHVNELLAAGQRAERLVQQVLAFGRQQARSPVRSALDDLIGQCAAVATESLTGSMDLRVELGAAGTDVVVDPDQMEQVLVQLVANAESAMNGSGRLTIRTALISWDDEMRQRHPFVPVGEYACITVADTGAGIDAAMLPLIFEPFFTTMEPSGSSGMGLAEAYGIVKQSGGYILVDSDVGKGTRVQVLLQPVPGRGAVQPSGQVFTVLIVHDDESLQPLVGAVLRRGAYRVLEARSAAEAFLRCELCDGEVEVAVVDLALPGNVAAGLAVRIRELCPHVRVLFLGGEPPVPGVAPAGDAVLRRPFDAGALHNAVCALVSGAALIADGGTG